MGPVVPGGVVRRRGHVWPMAGRAVSACSTRAVLREREVGSSLWLDELDDVVGEDAMGAPGAGAGAG